MTQGSEYVTARLVLGQALLALGALEEAEAEFSLALQLAPDNLLALQRLGIIHAEQGRWAKARECYERVLRLNPLDQVSMGGLAALPAEAPPVPSLAPVSAPELPAAVVAEPAVSAAEAVEAVLEEALVGLPAPAEPSVVEEVAVPALEEAPAPVPAVDSLASMTLAGLYASQGYTAEAEAIYAQLGRRLEGEPVSPVGGTIPDRRPPEEIALEMLLAYREAARRLRGARRSG